MSKINLFGLSLKELTRFLVQMGEPRFRARQVFQWMYQKDVSDFDAMTNLPLSLRQTLDECALVEGLTEFSRKESSDGAKKYLFHVDEVHRIESVYMPADHGVSFCISTQLGCAQGCRFCQTGQIGLIRNLTAGEIAGQIQTMVRDQTVDPPFNIMVMGMGEPLLNLKNMITALEIFTSADGFGLSPKHITVSTSGHVPNLMRLMEVKNPPRIAISLNASSDTIRNQLMPVNRRWPIASVIEACRRLSLPRRERVTFEYVLIGGVNDAEEDAIRLGKLLGDLRCKVNLIEFNETPDLPFFAPNPRTVQKFRNRLDDAGLTHTLRKSRGKDIGAACGQLAGKPLRSHGQLAESSPKSAE